MKDLNKQAIQVIKLKAKSLGRTQQDLAHSLSVSLPTIKRWYGGGNLTLGSLKKIANEVGLSLTEVFASIEESNQSTFNYTPEQEVFFAKHPDFLAYFDNLLRGQTPAQIQRKFGLSERKSIQFLSKLEKLKLIEWLPKNKVRLLVTGEPVWRLKGPLSTKLRQDVFESFMAHEQSAHAHFLLHDYLPEDRAEITRKLQDLIDLAKRANGRAKFRPENSKPAGLYLSLQDFRWNLDDYLTENQ